MGTVEEVVVAATVAPWWAWVLIVTFFGGIIAKVISNKIKSAGKTGSKAPYDPKPRTPPRHTP